MKPSSILFFVGVCVISIAMVASAETEAVGDCRPKLVSYPTISAAVAAVPSGSTVLVCPGTYPEAVTITTPLTLQGLTQIAGTRSVYVRSITVQQTGPVNISNMVIGQSGAAGWVLAYTGAEGTVEGVDVRGGGIGIVGDGVTLGSNVTVRNSSVSGAGIYASGPVGGESTLDLKSNWIAYTGAGNAIDYESDSSGLIENNTILLPGGTTTGIVLDYFFGTVTVSGNTIIGANVGITLYSTEAPATITGNHIFNSGTGILDDQEGGTSVIDSNTIAQSNTVAINFVVCNDGNDYTYEHNTIVDAPIGIENEGRGDISSGNAFYNVATPTTTCTAP